MKTLSIMQPWATLIAIGAKHFETRSWNTRHRGLLAIHASKGFPRAAIELCSVEPFQAALRGAGFEKATDLPRGMIIATATLKTTHPTQNLRLDLDERELAFGFYDDGRFAWELIDIERLASPVIMRGSLGLWNCDELQ
jgi:hypothetical protein